MPVFTSPHLYRRGCLYPGLASREPKFVLVSISMMETYDRHWRENASVLFNISIERREAPHFNQITPVNHQRIF